MNFRLPLETLPGYLPVIGATVLCLISVGISWALLSFDRQSIKLNKTKKMSQKQKQKLNAEKKRIQKQEKYLK